MNVAAGGDGGGVESAGRVVRGFGGVVGCDAGDAGVGVRGIRRVRGGDGLAVRLAGERRA